MTPSNPADGKPTAAGRTVAFERLDGVRGAGGIITARTAQQRRERHLIQAHTQYEQKPRRRRESLRSYGSRPFFNRCSDPMVIVIIKAMILLPPDSLLDLLISAHRPYAVTRAVFPTPAASAVRAAPAPTVPADG